MAERVSGQLQQLSVRRLNIVTDIIDQYGNIDVSRPIQVAYVGEEGVDQGGLTKDMFGLFWEKIGSVGSMWFRGENAIVPFVPLAQRAEAKRVFPILGKILEHMVCIVGHFPPQLCRSVVLALAHPDEDVDPAIVMEDYLLFLPEIESNLLRECLALSVWSESQKRRLLRFFSVNKMSVNPTPKTLKKNLLNIAHVELIDASHMHIALMRRGLSRFVIEQFFDKLDPAKVRAMYESREATAEKVAQLVDDFYETVDLSRDEEIVVDYLSNFIRGMNKKQLRRFLVWLTGSSCMPEKIDITFNASRGIARAPVAHTCGNVLEIPREYTSYQDFEREFGNILQSEESFRFTVVE